MTARIDAAPSMATLAGRSAAEKISEVVADIRAGRVDHPAAFDSSGKAISGWLLSLAQRPQPVVECTAIYDSQPRQEVVALYEDHPSITPPWADAFLCYVNAHGNVICMQVHRVDWDGTKPSGNRWYSENEVDWSAVRWVAETSIWVGGTSADGRPLPTSGPCHSFRHAIRADGSPEDINWLALMAPRGQTGEPDPNSDIWDATLITLGAALNFLNASNVDIAEPSRPRAERRRIARTGVAVQTIVVRPPGKRRASAAAVRPIDDCETVLSQVRGHFSHYGPQYGRGLLFGKLTGKFWIPGHIRGVGDGEEPKNYVLKPSAESAQSDFPVDVTA